MKNWRRLVLASTSPQRYRLLETLGLSFEVVAPKLEEEIIEEKNIHNSIAKLALAKAESIASSQSNALIIGADTIVCQDGKIMGKPRGKSEAESMLLQLRGKTHQVISGVAVLNVTDGRFLHTAVETEVRMRLFSTSELAAYLSLGESIGRAGAYAIQERGMLLTDGIKGSWSNVVGLPLEKLYQFLLAFGKDALACHK